MARIESNIYDSIEESQETQRSAKEFLRRMKVRCAVLPRKYKRLSTKTKAFLSRIHFRRTQETSWEQQEFNPVTDSNLVNLSQPNAMKQARDADENRGVVGKTNVSKAVTEMRGSVELEKQTPVTTRETLQGAQQQDGYAEQETGERWCIEASDARSHHGDTVTVKRSVKVDIMTGPRTSSEQSSTKSRLTKLGKTLLQTVRTVMVKVSSDVLRAVGMRHTSPRRMWVDRLVMVHFRMVILQIAGFVVILGEEYGGSVYYHVLAPVVCWIIRRLVSF